MTAESPPLVVLAGMPRTGTTSLFHILGEHPALFRPFRKEVGAFLFNADRGLAWHAALYRERLPGQIGLDVTPEYFFSREAAQRIAHHLPEARVLLGVRDPVAFALSLHSEYRRRRYDVPDLATFLHGYRYHRRGCPIAFSLGREGVVRMIECYRALLGSRLLLWDYEMFRKAPLDVLRGIECFLGVAPYFDRTRFRNLYLNSSKRRDARWLSYLLAHEELVGALRHLLPRRALVGLARTFYAIQSSGRPPTSTRPEVDSLPSEFQRRFAEEREAIHRLFSQGPMLLGDGSLWGPTGRVPSPPH